MNGYYAGKIKVVCEDLMCFPVRVIDLEPTSCSTYDQWALSDPDPEPVETISVSEWNLRCIAREDAEREKLRRDRRARHLRADS